MHTYTVTCETLSKRSFRRHIAKLFGRPGERGLVLKAPYCAVEYLSAPAGLIVLAHHNTIDGQADGIHPACLSKCIDRPVNIIEPLRNVAEAYNVHYMTRRSQGALVREAFGRMIDGGDPEAPRVETDRHFTLEIFSVAGHPLVAVIEEGHDRVYLLQVSANHVVAKEAA